MLTDKKKRIALMIVIVIAASLPGLYATLNRIWTRTYPDNEFGYDWIAPPEFEGFVCNTWEEYQAQTESLALVGGSTMVTVTQDTYTSEHGETLLMDFTLQTSSLGARLMISGQYVTVKYIEAQKLIEPVGAAFNIPSDIVYAPNMASMTWSDPMGNTGYALRLTFSIDSSNCVEPEGVPSGTIYHSYDVIVGIGLETTPET